MIYENLSNKALAKKEAKARQELTQCRKRARMYEAQAKAACEELSIICQEQQRRKRP